MPWRAACTMHGSMTSTSTSSFRFGRAVLVFALVSSGIAIAASSCGGTVQHTQGFPEKHREVAQGCPTTRPPGITDAGAPSDAGPPLGGNCKVDGDCTKGPNGRCMFVGHLGGPMCTYDACAQDSDCKGGEVCQCDGTGNRCLAANCTTDTSCGTYGCSPTFNTSCGPYSGIQGYYCHTAADSCVNDKDCEAGAGYCAFDPKVGHWACSYGICVG